MSNPYLPREAKITERIQETGKVFSLRLQLTDPAARESYRFAPGQFNMLYAFGVGEVPISVIRMPGWEEEFGHTIRPVGRVTRLLAAYQEGDRVGIRGPFGRGWPLEEARGQDVVVVTGGLGCAPAVTVIDHVLDHREDFGRLVIMQGVKHSDDLIWREQYEKWAKLPRTQVLLAADEASGSWIGHQGLVTELFQKAEFDRDSAMVMMCGPEPMMLASARELLDQGSPPDNLWLSMERNMQCAIGHCGHCQFGGDFVCKDGPVFPYPRVRNLLGVKGF